MGRMAQTHDYCIITPYQNPLDISCLTRYLFSMSGKNRNRPKYNEVIFTRCTESEKDRLAREAQKRGASLTDLVRLALGLSPIPQGRPPKK